MEAGSTGHLPSVHGGQHWEHQLGPDRVGGVDVVTPVVHGVGDEATEPLVEVPRSTVKRLTHRKEERLPMFCRSGVAVCLSATGPTSSWRLMPYQPFSMYLLQRHREKVISVGDPAVTGHLALLELRSAGAPVR